MLAKNDTRFGVAVPQMFAPGTAIDMGLVHDHLRRAESLGYESAWVQDHTLGRMQTLDPLTLLAHCATCTARMKLGVAVLVMPYRNPVNLAKTMATLDHLSGGRIILGVGIGRRGSEATFGIPAEARVARFEESIGVLKWLWTEPGTDFRGRFWKLDGVTVEPKPAQRPHLPIWFGGHVDVALRRAARMGDGWMGAGVSSTAAFKEAIRKVRDYLAEAKRAPGTYPLSKRVYVAVDRDKARAERKLREWFGVYYGDAELAMKVSVFGPEQEVVDGVGELVAERPDMLMFNPVYDLLEQPERLARDIVPKL